MLLLSLLFSQSLWCQHKVQYLDADNHKPVNAGKVDLQQQFSSGFEAVQYIARLPSVLHSRGFIGASIDSTFTDSLQTIAWIYLGEQYRWKEILVDSTTLPLIEAAGINLKDFNNRNVNLDKFSQNHDRLLQYLENNGYPFAKVSVDSISIDGPFLTGKLSIEKGPLYKIDSVRNLGNARISNDFLQRYLSILPGTIFRKEKLQTLSNRLSELPYVKETKPWDLTLLGTGSILNLYLDNQKSSQVNVLVGLLPASSSAPGSKMQVTGEANINLRNALGNGELIGLNWQQIQVRSPRLNLQYQHPYLFKSPFGMDFHFDLFKKDSSFVNIDLRIGATYAISSSNTGSVFLRSWSSNLLTVDTFQVKNSRRLPEQADISSIQLGVSYDVNKTDYRFNPRRGNELNLVLTTGTRKVRENHVIAQLVDENDPSFKFSSLYDSLKKQSYQVRLQFEAAHYFPVGKAAVVKTGIRGGWMESPDIFRNELFQVGGYKTLRGFDEESEYVSGYSVLTAEYRYLVGRNSYFFAFVDGGWSKNKSLASVPSYTYLGLGAGMAFETKAGIFNLSWAVGKRSDGALNLRQSKIHLGYINYF